MSVAPFEQIGPYRIGRRLGSGGMGEVLLAQKIGFAGMKSSVVIKLLHAHLGRDPRARAFFINEAKLATMLDHPNIVKVIEAGEADGRLYLVMEYVDGVNLTTFLDHVREKGRTLPLEDPVICYIIAEVLKGLVYAHGLTIDGRDVGIIHLDMTPNNILISSSGNVKVADFGLSRVAVEAETISCVAGTPRYMSPEHINATPRRETDVYCVGTIAHELLSNRKIHAGLDTSQRREAILQGVVYPLGRDDLEPWLLQVVHQMLARDYTQRPTSLVASEIFLRNATGYGQASLELAKMYKDVVGRQRSGQTQFMRAVPDHHESLVAPRAPAVLLGPQPSPATMGPTMSTPPPTSAREPDAPTSVEPPPLLVERPAEEPLEATELLPGFAESHLPDPAPRMDATRTDSARADSNSAAVAFAAPENSPGSATMPRLLLVGVSVGIIASLAGVGWTIGTLVSDDAEPESEVAAREDEEQPAAAVAHQPAPNALEPVPEVDEQEQKADPPVVQEPTPTPETEDEVEVEVEGEDETGAEQEEPPEITPTKTKTRPKKAAKTVMVIVFIKGYHGAGAIKLGSRQYAVKGGYVKIPKLAPRTYTAKWRTGDTDPWHDAGKIVVKDIAPNYYQFTWARPRLTKRSPR